MAQRVLRALGITPDKDLQASYIGLDAAVVALREGGIDAFFWSGGLPTRGVADLATSTPIRLLTVQEDLARIHAAYPEYAPAPCPRAPTGSPSR